jgi:hypothetical protein
MPTNKVILTPEESDLKVRVAKIVVAGYYFEGINLDI